MYIYGNNHVYVRTVDLKKLPLLLSPLRQRLRSTTLLGRPMSIVTAGHANNISANIFAVMNCMAYSKHLVGHQLNYHNNVPVILWESSSATSIQYQKRNTKYGRPRVGQLKALHFTLVNYDLADASMIVIKRQTQSFLYNFMGIRSSVCDIHNS